MSAVSLVTSATPEEPTVLRLRDVREADVVDLLARYEVRFVRVEDGAPIPGSFWGDSEAGIIAGAVYARGDTPLHSLLHEACHLIVLPPEVRMRTHTNATDSVFEEDATCYLQLLLADRLPGFGIDRAFADMDAWGYTFRLGSARAWFERDAEDAAAFLQALPHLRQMVSVPAERRV